LKTTQIRNQQQEFNRRVPSAGKTELDVYNAADSCTLAIEYLVCHFSTRFFHYGGPESIISMIATIDADATKLDDLRIKQRQVFAWGYALEKKIIQTEAHIRELAELAKRIRDEPINEAEAEEEEKPEGTCMDENMDAEGDSDPEFAQPGKANGGGNHS
jgi:hypothetical protein